MCTDVWIVRCMVYTVYKWVEKLCACVFTVMAIRLATFFPIVFRVFFSSRFIFQIKSNKTKGKGVLSYQKKEHSKWKKKKWNWNGIKQIIRNFYKWKLWHIPFKYAIFGWIPSKANCFRPILLRTTIWTKLKWERKKKKMWLPITIYQFRKIFTLYAKTESMSCSLDLDLSSLFNSLHTFIRSLFFLSSSLLSSVNFTLFRICLVVRSRMECH